MLYICYWLSVNCVGVVDLYLLFTVAAYLTGGFGIFGMGFWGSELSSEGDILRPSNEPLLDYLRSLNLLIAAFTMLLDVVPWP
jgi:hypothetical protein